MIDVEAPDQHDLATVRAWIDGHLAADVDSISVTPFDVTVGLTNGVSVELPRVNVRLMADLEQAISLARREAPPKRLRPLYNADPPDAEDDEELVDP